MCACVCIWPSFFRSLAHLIASSDDHHYNHYYYQHYHHCTFQPTIKDNKIAPDRQAKATTEFWEYSTPTTATGTDCTSVKKKSAIFCRLPFRLDGGVVQPANQLTNQIHSDLLRQPQVVVEETKTKTNCKFKLSCEMWRIEWCVQ